MVKLKSTFVGLIFYLGLVLVKDLTKCVAQSDVQYSRPRSFDHRFGFRRTTSADQTSSFLLHTPYEALHSTILAPSRYVHHETRTPASILQHRRRLSKQHLTTNMPTVTSTPLRGDQQPQIDDYESTYGSEEIVLLKNQPATVAPYFFTNERSYRPPQRVHPCEKSSCYPATGNLLIGREERLVASSTCGTRSRERFCIVSHLEDTKCFSCETNERTVNDPLLNHRIGQIIYKNQPGTRVQSWWQSENGVPNVTIQLDLEAEFHFTHLIIVFQTFRPAAMLIERSYDFGRTWHVYRYFAHRCAESFPGVPRHSVNITDVVCDERYSSVEPSKNGEVIFRVLSPQHSIDNPYADHIQNMLKMTNLRINFTRLHNLGDTLLDDRQEIQEKYYYAISNMVVRGSCSCYGHASQCLPLEGVANKVDMVHGRCDCTHNTKGLNCEECQDFYNDLPWKPALGKQTNACKACNCNNHTNTCHFDQAVYEHSGRVSGGVCDNCDHNTQGQHCEECIPFFYRDPVEPLNSPYVCRRCDCDPRGAVDEGICDSITDDENEAGKCHCKKNVGGRRCDTCMEGFWNLDANNTEGCETCTCNTLGTVGNLGCNMFTGECVCKRLVMGKDCNQCMQETFGLSATQDGCQFCDCDPGGSLDNHCDVITGQCTCRDNMTGRRCDTPKQNYFVPSLHITYEAELPPTECETDSSYGNCTIVLREPPTDGRAPWTGPGYERVNEGNELVFTIGDLPKTMPYDVVVRYQTQSRGDWEVAKITVVRPDEYDPEGPCPNSHPSYEDRVPFTLPERGSSVIALQNVCLEHGKIYKIKLLFERQRTHEPNPAAQILIDSIATIPRIDATEVLTKPENNQIYTENNCNSTFYGVDFDDRSPEECKNLLNSVSIYVFDGAGPCSCNPTGSYTKKCEEFGGRCQCKPNVVGRQCDKCAPGYYGFGPEGCTACDCNSIGAADNNCDQATGQCKCHPNTYGRVCDQCQTGFWNFPSCQICECNGHAQTCDQLNGECLDCADFTNGRNCERCIDGFYGDPLLGSEIGCRPCRCPDTVASGHTHSDYCQLDPRSNDMICYCKEGYSGPRCDVCAENYYGHPESSNGTCEQCNCSDNVDLGRAGNCDLQTGKCLQCLYETAGDNCEYCRDGFYGNALEHNCRQCDCDVLGTDGELQYCDRYSGQCPCLKNVEGVRCDRCKEDYWKIASGEGCEACDCDPVGSESSQCNPYDGQCRCKDGFGGRQCNECQANFWGDPNVECRPCECDPYGSATQQCDRTTGQCKCILGIGGYKCNECARGFLGQAPYCQPCGECFDNWDSTLNSLREETRRVIEEAKQIKKTGATGAYTKEFEAMEKQIATIRSLLNNATISSQDIRELEALEEKIRKELNDSLSELQVYENRVEDLFSNVNLGNAALEDLRKRGEEINANANQLKENATVLQEANVEGALNLTRQAYQKANILTQMNAEAQELSENAQKQCHRTEQLVNRSIDEFNALQLQNENDLDESFLILQNLTSKLPDLNEQICDKRGDPCDSVCGGAGCSHCGGFSCENGALTRAQKALEYVQDAEKKIKEKEDVADDLIRSLSQAKANATEAYKKAEAALALASNYFNRTKSMIIEGEELIGNLTAILNNNTASPAEIKKLADETLELNLQLDPEQIKELADKIDETVSQLENVDQIIESTRSDLARATNLKDVSFNTSERADKVLEEAQNLVKALDEADQAQEKAKNAIAQANEDIALAKADLEKIDEVTVEAQLKANETATKVDTLFEELNKLQKNVLKNEFEAKEIQDQSEKVYEAANKAHDGAVKLRNTYREANDSLTEKAAATESARARAQQLLQRASSVTVNTQNKLVQLQTMTDTYQNNERDLQSLQARIDSLNDELTGYVDRIQERSDYYRTCSS